MRTSEYHDVVYLFRRNDRKINAIRGFFGRIHSLTEIFNEMA